MRNGGDILWFPALLLPIRNERELVLKFSASFATSLSVAYVLTLVYLTFFTPSEELLFFKESTYGAKGSLGNVAVLAAIIVGTIVTILALLRMGKLSILKLAFTILLSYVFGTLVAFYASLLIALVGIYSDAIYYSLFAASIAIGIASLLTPRLLSLRNAVLLFAGAMIGALFGTSFGFYTPLILMAVFTALDSYLVLKGPLGAVMADVAKIYEGEGSDAEGAQETEVAGEQRREFLLIGLGDLAFLSMPVAYALAYFGALASLIVLSSIMAGVLVETAVLRKRRGALPGLPIPYILALATLIPMVVF